MSDNGNKKDVDLKILLLGESNVGKTTFLLKYFVGEFIVNLEIIWCGVNLFRKMIVKKPTTEDPTIYFINIWDIDGKKNILNFIYLITEPINAIIIQTTSDIVEYSLNKWIKVLKRFITLNFVKFLIITNKNKSFLEENTLQDLTKQFNSIKYFVIDSKYKKQTNNTFEFIFNNIITT